MYCVVGYMIGLFCFFFFKQKTAYEMRISDWSSDVCSSDLPATRFDAAAGRHFYGHGVFSPDGRWLYACENDYDNARGCIGIYDATAGYRREAELEAYAIGPHEMVLLSDGRPLRSEEHTSALQSLMRISYAVFCLEKKH